WCRCPIARSSRTSAPPRSAHAIIWRRLPHGTCLPSCRAIAPSTSSIRRFSQTSNDHREADDQLPSLTAHPHPYPERHRMSAKPATEQIHDAVQHRRDEIIALLMDLVGTESITLNEGPVQEKTRAAMEARGLTIDQWQ